MFLLLMKQAPSMSTLDAPLTSSAQEVAAPCAAPVSEHPKLDIDALSNAARSAEGGAAVGGAAAATTYCASARAVEELTAHLRSTHDNATAASIRAATTAAGQGAHAPAAPTLPPQRTQLDGSAAEHLGKRTGAAQAAAAYHADARTEPNGLTQQNPQAVAPQEAPSAAAEAGATEGGADVDAKATESTPTHVGAVETEAKKPRAKQGKRTARAQGAGAQTHAGHEQLAL